jgi:NAD/NADP transhydrogenase beta subunit
MFIASLFAIVGCVAFVGSVIADQKVQNALIDTLPPQFQDSLNSRYAFDVYMC